MIELVQNIAGTRWPALDLSYCASNEPPPLDFVLPGLVLGTVGSTVAPGATGKSWFALQDAALVGAGIDLLGFGQVKQGRVLLLAKEDPAEVLWARTRVLTSRMTGEQLDAWRENVVILPCYGRPGDLMEQETSVEIIKLAEHVGGVRLILLDTLSKWHSGDENDRRDAAKVMRAMERIAQAVGASVVFLHHTNKAAAMMGDGDRQQASRGSSVFVDEARWVAFLQTATDEEAEKFGIDEAMRRLFVRFGVSKANYCPPQPDIWLRRETGGVLVKYQYPMKEARRPSGKGKAEKLAAALGGEIINDPESL